MKMRIGVNLLYLIPSVVGGTETYAISLLRSLASVDQENEYWIFVNRESAEMDLPESPRFHRVICRVSSTNRFNRYGWEQFMLPMQLRSHRIDLVHSLGYVGPLLSVCPCIVTIPDLNYVALRDTLPLGKRVALRFFSTQSARRSNHVITISNFSKDKISGLLRINPDKITVTYLGPRIETASLATDNWSRLKDHYGIEEPYVIAFGGKALHKNILRLVHAFSEIKEQFPHRLILIGHVPTNVQLSLEMAREGMTGRIIATGYVPEEEILPLLSHADLFVLPSLYEGFGMPVVEAQQAGVAVACSNAGSLPEVGGEGALYFDPMSVDDMIRVMRLCLQDDDLRSRLVKKGHDNLRRFSWETTARKTLGVYQGVHAGFHRMG